ncbi:SxtJ family membrane protein [Bradyrhizobium sp. CCGUVB23]|uniref:SxtJ family membrane protein n=1 Tax=Bradyrhizobium sp. CCGUVB23 TaxID=2949630 RepID=UPI0020B33F2A|nr:SxtJ family membrane protein [Bradyrhizobium sp. CCGUVB23]MCP3459247.1 SxtJ family membrane protein [Bradyrhizobium sp. CCGUVB23]
MTANDSIQSHRKVTIGTERNFGIVFTIVLVVVGLGPLYHGGAVRWWAISLGGAFLVCAFVAPRLLRPLNQLWFRFGLMLHQVVNPIVMGALFFGAVVPMGLVVRALGKNLLNLKFDRTAASYWIRRDPPAPPIGGMTRQF